MQSYEGLRRMQAEMSRQRGDALATLDGNDEAAAGAAASARKTGSIVLCAMGGSHHVNTIMAPLYRMLGLDCRAMTASEFLSSPLPTTSHTLLIASQSGRSGEIVQLLQTPGAGGEKFALTLDGESVLAKSCNAALVAHGGAEQAFAATRSITLTLAMHGAILNALGISKHALRVVFKAADGPEIDKVEVALAPCKAVIFAGYGAMAGVASSAALSMMELARVLTIGFEGGQFRHGPFEVLQPGLGIVLFRDAGPDGTLVQSLAESTLEAGCSTIIFDASGQAVIPGVTTVPLPRNTGTAAAASMLLALQPLNIAVALSRVRGDVGTPLRTSKVTI
jgi:fructoselysine-6-P-deglycase FrlB-like protein